jgi:transposase InsO family protein
MSKARLVITAVVIEGRPQAEVARAYGVSKGWVSKLVTRYRTEGATAFEPRSRRPRSSPNATDPATVELIIELRHQLLAVGLDAGADTIGWHLEHHHRIVISPATIWRHLKLAGLVEPDPKKRPRSSYIRFEADFPNECWQSDFTHYRLADGSDTEILTWLDDHSRYALRISVHQPITAKIVLAEFRNAINEYGPPASTLTDNGMVYTVRFATGPGGRTGFEAELARLGIVQKNSQPNHPTTCGKVERFQQTLKRWLDAQTLPETVAELQALCDTFRTIYNTTRPHRSLPHHATPQTIYSARPKATPTGTIDNHYRVRHDRIDDTGKITLRVNSRLPTSASDEPTPEPTSSSSSTTSTSASSPPPPANSSATSPSTPTATTSPPADPKTTPNPKTNGPNPTEGSDRPRCLATSQSGGDGT